jgi:hypothetical protein
MEGKVNESLGEGNSKFELLEAEREWMWNIPEIEHMWYVNTL